ncbi:MAG TPA: ATP-binding protein, partial [Elusimicrobiales bacterium]|nr:ATP-binding protein [Elusimicrobiales bacterium]
VFGYIDEATGDYMAPGLSSDVMRRRGIRTLPVRFRPGRRGAAFFAAPPDMRRAVRGKTRISGAGMREAASVVVFFDSRPLGFITLERTNAGFSDQDLSRLERLAQHLAPILGARIEKQRQEAENQRMMTEFISAQRIESLGVIAGGIAHDFNNMLSGIMGNLSLLNMELPAGAKGWREMTSEAMDATENARLLAKQLITFSKGGANVRKRVDLGALARKAALFATRGSNCSPKFELPMDLWPVSGDETQLTQAIHNLVINSVQAMPCGGEIAITAANEPHMPRPARRAAKNRYVVLRIRDTGCGISQKDLKRIFEPFFSTKSTGRGLGLPMSQTIITSHGGRIELDFSAGKGSCFTIRLPAASGHRKAEICPGGVPAPQKGSGRILVMEDDPILSASLSRMLRALGYAPLHVGNGEKAVDAYAEAERAGLPFRAVIMDLMIPGGMGGEEAVKRLKAMYPKAKVLLSSGYAEAPAAADHSAYGFDGVIHKPYGVDALAGALAAVLS